MNANENTETDTKVKTEPAHCPVCGCSCTEWMDGKEQIGWLCNHCSWRVWWNND
jgi:hypothetical protein